MSFTFKDRISISIFGSSHGSALGCILDGIPSGFRIDENKVSLWMSRRAPGQSSLTTQRKETDQVEFISGINNCYTDGGPITMLIRNKDVIERHYDELKEKPRPGLHVLQCMDHAFPELLWWYFPSFLYPQFPVLFLWRTWP